MAAMDPYVEQAATDASRWFESLSAAEAPQRLFCFPYAGGDAQSFRGWQRHFAPEVDVCLAHLPGRGRRLGAPRFTRLQQLVEAIADVIGPKVEGPFAFYGHSMGAIISFELARELRRRNAGSPLHLFLSGRQAPGMRRIGPRMFALPEKEFIAELHKLNGTPMELFDDPQIKDLFIPLLRADFEMVDTYECSPGPPLACPMTVYGGSQDERAPVDSLNPWAMHTTAQCTVRILPGDHFFIQKQSSQFINVLRRDLLAALPQRTEEQNR
jgi:medium-chain acyl-[acyl-carrier-protein] hydrolase